MVSDLPSWLTKGFLKTALENGKVKGEVTINDFDAELAVAKGNNYVCDIFRVKITYSSEDENNAAVHVIVKAPRSGGLYDQISKMGIVDKEASIYKLLLPKISIINNGELLTPKLLACSEDSGLVLEDLKFEGYEMKDRHRQLDFEHCSMALSKLAVFHAASVKLHETEPELVKKVGKECFFHSQLMEKCAEYSIIFYEAAAKEIATWPGCEKYSEGLSGYGRSSSEILAEMVKPKEDEFNVLNHGDFWVTNMLFKYSNGKPVDVKLIDLQVSRYASPACDLLYFFAGSVPEDVRTGRFDELLAVYLKSLNSALERFGIKQRLDEMELRKAMDERDFFFLHFTITLLPIVLADEIVEFKDLSEEDLKRPENNPFCKNLQGAQFKAVLPKRLAELESKGWF